MLCKPDKSTTLVFDVGGTKIHGGIYDLATRSIKNDKCINTPNFLRDRDGTYHKIIDALWDAIKQLGDELLAGSKPDIVVVGFPGPILQDGTALRAPTILGPTMDTMVPIRHDVSRIWPDAEIFVLNDVTAAGYFYRAMGYRDFCVITVGSGVGNKLFLDGKPVVGPSAYGGELGHLRVSHEYECANTSLPPDIGEFSSGRGLASLYETQLTKSAAESAMTERRQSPHLLASTSDKLVEMFRCGDHEAVNIVKHGTAPLAHALAAVHLAVGVEKFFITGGMASALGEQYKVLLTDLFKLYVWDVGQDWASMFSLAKEREKIALTGAGHYGTGHRYPTS